MKLLKYSSWKNKNQFNDTLLVQGVFRIRINRISMNKQNCLFLCVCVFVWKGLVIYNHKNKYKSKRFSFYVSKWKLSVLSPIKSNFVVTRFLYRVYKFLCNVIEMCSNDSWSINGKKKYISLSIIMYGKSNKQMLLNLIAVEK